MRIVNGRSIEGLSGLEFRNFEEIPDFDKKLTEFLNGLDEELKTWRDFAEKNGKRSIPHGITAGYACLDGDKIVGIYYLFPLRPHAKKYSFMYFPSFLFPQEEIESASVVKKEYQRRGIFKHSRNLVLDLAREMGYKGYIYSVDTSNIWSGAMKRGDRIINRTDKKIYFVSNLVEGDHYWKKHRILLFILIQMKELVGFFTRKIQRKRSLKMS